MEEIKYKDDIAMGDLIAIAKGLLDVVASKGIAVSYTAVPEDVKGKAFVVVNAGKYTFRQFYGEQGKIIDTESRREVPLKEVCFDEESLS